MPWSWRRVLQGGYVLEYGQTFLESNQRAIERLEESMTPEGLRAARAMLAEFLAMDELYSEVAVTSISAERE